MKAIGFPVTTRAFGALTLGGFLYRIGKHTSLYLVQKGHTLHML